MITATDLRMLLEENNINTIQLGAAINTPSGLLLDCLNNKSSLSVDQTEKIIKWSSNNGDCVLFNIRVDKFMDRHGMSTRQFCFALGISASTLSRWMNGTRTPSETMIETFNMLDKMSHINVLNAADDGREEFKQRRKVRKRKGVSMRQAHTQYQAAKEKSSGYFVRNKHRVGAGYIVALRAASVLTQNDLGRMIGVSAERIGRWERRLDTVLPSRKAQLKVLGKWMSDNNKPLQKSPYWENPVPHRELRMVPPEENVIEDIVQEEVKALDVGSPLAESLSRRHADEEVHMQRQDAIHETLVSSVEEAQVIFASRLRAIEQKQDEQTVVQKNSFNLIHNQLDVLDADLVNQNIRREKVIKFFIVSTAITWASLFVIGLKVIGG